MNSDVDNYKGHGDRCCGSFPCNCSCPEECEYYHNLGCDVSVHTYYSYSTEHEEQYDDKSICSGTEVSDLSDDGYDCNDFDDSCCSGTDVSDLSNDDFDGSCCSGYSGIGLDNYIITKYDFEIEKNKANIKLSQEIIKRNAELHDNFIKDIDIGGLADNILLKKFPEVAKKWYYLKNGDVKPWEVAGGSKKHAWWLCDKYCEIGGCLHAYPASIDNTSTGYGCPFCFGTSTFCVHDSLEYLYPAVAKLFHPTKNSPLTASTILSTSHKNLWWLCPDVFDCGCLHEFQSIVKTLVRYISVNGYKGCPFCSNHKHCIHSSFGGQYPELAKEWHTEKNGNLTPFMVAPKGHDNVWWKCFNIQKCNCSHDYQTRVQDRTQQNSGCQLCSGSIVCIHTSLASTHPEVCKSWIVSKNSIKPTDVLYGSGKIIWWICENNHEFQMTVRNKVIGFMCYECKTTTEKQLFDFLKIKYNVGLHPKFEWCKNLETNRHLPFDFEITQFNLIIELDGIQHFKNHTYFKTTVDEQLENDILKTKRANKNGYTVIRLTQMNVYSNKNDWKNKLVKLIKKYDTPSVIYIDDGDIYDQHKKQFTEYVDEEIDEKPKKVVKKVAKKESNVKPKKVSKNKK